MIQMFIKAGSLNVRGCNDGRRKSEIEELRRVRDEDGMALRETKLKGKYEEFFANKLGYKSGMA